MLVPLLSLPMKIKWYLYPTSHKRYYPSPVRWCGAFPSPSPMKISLISATLSNFFPNIPILSKRLANILYLTLIFLRFLPNSRHFTVPLLEVGIIKGWCIWHMGTPPPPPKIDSSCERLLNTVRLTSTLNFRVEHYYVVGFTKRSHRSHSNYM